MFKEDEALFKMSNCILQLKPCVDIEHNTSVLNWSEYVKLRWNLNPGKGKNGKSFSNSKKEKSNVTVTCGFLFS